MYNRCKVKDFRTLSVASDTLIEWIDNCLNCEIVQKHTELQTTGTTLHITNDFIFMAFIYTKRTEWIQNETQKWVRNAKIIDVIRFIIIKLCWRFSHFPCLCKKLSECCISQIEKFCKMDLKLLPCNIYCISIPSARNAFLSFNLLNLVV